MQPLLLVMAMGLVLLNAFFVATEFAIVKVRGTRIEELARAGSGAASLAQPMVQNLDGYLSATQLGITLASLGLGWIGEPAFAKLLEPLALAAGFDTEAATHAAAAAVAFAIITFLHIVLGELAPKSLAIQRAEGTTLWVALPMRLFYVVFWPFIWMLNSFATFLLKLFGLRPAGEGGDAPHSEEELRMILAHSVRSGQMAAERAQLLRRALAFAKKTARQMMRPRQRVSFLDVQEPMDDLWKRVRETGFTRFPLIDGDPDEVVGIVNVKDLLVRGEQPRNAVELRARAKPALFVPEAASAEALLRQLKSDDREMAVVVDEYGGVSGIITLHDVVEEVVGELGPHGARPLPATGPLTLPGACLVDELAERLSANVDQTGVTTVAGYLQRELGRLPRVGDRVPFGERMIEVLEAEETRVTKVRVS